MKDSSKPLLPNGYSLTVNNENVTVLRRLDKKYFIDVYELSNYKILYLFLKNKPGESYFDPNLYTPMVLKVGKKEYFAIVCEHHSLDNLLSVLDTINRGKTGFQAVAGMKELKNVFYRDVIQPLLNPEKYRDFKIPLPNGILLYGPPGCGKTFIVKKLAEELNYSFFELKHSDVGSPYIHQTAMKIEHIFEMARINAPSIVFIDEIEGFVPKREHLESSTQYKQEEVNEFLRQLNDAGKNSILVIGATNRPELIDTAILRAGRMDKRIFVPPPDFEARKELFQLYLSERPHAKEIDYDKLANMTEGHVCADIELIINESARSAIAQNKPVIDEELIQRAILQSVPSFTKTEMENYKRFADIER